MADIKRNDLLDITKGIGIMLVVLGHTLQGLYPDYDHNLIFRLIYSFHMPLFFFVSGCVLSLNTKFAQPTQQSNLTPSALLKALLNKCKKSFLHLMVPFFIWTIVLFFTGKRFAEVGFSEWLLMVAKSADYSLWFLIAMFNCLIFYYLSEYLFSVSKIEKNPQFNQLKPQYKQVIFLISSLLLSLVATKFMPNWMGLSFFKHYYLYIILGGLWQVYLRHISPTLVSLIAVLIFALLAPYWYRLEISPIVTFLLQHVEDKHIENLYKLIVATTGILTTLTVASVIQYIPLKFIKNFFAYCGTMSLGIYVFQFHFLGIKPYFFAALLLSLFACIIVSRIPAAKLLLLGMVDKKKSPYKNRQPS